MRFTQMSRIPPPPALPAARDKMLIGALLRVPAQAIHRRIIEELFAGMDVSEEVRRDILGLNAARLFGIEPRVVTSAKVAA